VANATRLTSLAGGIPSSFQIAAASSKLTLPLHFDLEARPRVVHEAKLRAKEHPHYQTGETIANGTGVEKDGRGFANRRNSNFVPGAKKMENWPPSGPIQNRSSPPNAFMCGNGFPEANQLTIDPARSLMPPSPPELLVIHPGSLLKTGNHREFRGARRIPQNDDLRVAY